MQSEVLFVQQRLIFSFPLTSFSQMAIFLQFSFFPVICVSIEKLQKFCCFARKKAFKLTSYDQNVLWIK